MLLVTVPDHRELALSLMLFRKNPQIDVPQGQLKIAHRFNARLPAGLGQVPKGRLKGGGGECVQSSLRDWNSMNGIPGVETPGYSRDVPSGHPTSNLCNTLTPTLTSTLPVISQERGRSCPREAKSCNLRTKLSTLRFAALITGCLLMLLPVAAHAQGGVPLWTNRYDGPANGNDRIDAAHAIAVDSSGNVFVTGESTGSGSSSDYATIAYSNSGVPLWTNRYNGPGNSMDFAEALAVDSSGNVFVTGGSWSGQSFTNSGYATVAYSSAGRPLWTNRYDGAGNTFGRARAIAVDRGGNVFVTGSSGTMQQTETTETT